jgi:hypothetical protein
MADYPVAGQLPLTIWTGGRYGIAAGARGTQGTSGGFVSVAWGTASLAFYTPMHIPFSYPVKNLFWYNFATLSGTVDAGVYNDDLTRVCSTGAITQAGATALQFNVPVTEVILQPGNYYFALVSSSATATLASMNSGSATHNRELGCFQQASSSPLPASAVITATATARIPLIGITYKTGTPTF